MPPAKKHIAATQLLTVSCIVPLIPWPLVHPPAQREPNPIRTPPVTEEIILSIAEDPKADSHVKGINWK
jgi:hypothetical protein